MLVGFVNEGRGGVAVDHEEESQMSQANVDLAGSTYEAFAEGDIERVIAVFDPQVEWVEPEVPELPEAGTHHGSDAIVQNVFAPAETDWEDFAAEPNAYYDAAMSS